MIAWHRTMRTPATTSTEHRAHSLSQRSLVFIRTHMHRGSSLSLSCHVHVHGHPCGLFTMILPFYFLLYLPLLFFFLQFLKFVVNLHNSCNESMDSTDEFSLSTGYEPKAPDFYETSVEPYMQLQDSPPFFSNKVSSADPDYGDSTLEDMLHQAHRAQAYHSLREDLFSVCRRRQCPIEQGDLLEKDRGDSVSTEAQKHRLGLCSTIKESRFLQNAKQELVNTNFKLLEPKKSNDSFKNSYYSKIWNYVKLIKEVSLKWKS